MLPENTSAAALVVTGGGRGIGAQIALRAARAAQSAQSRHPHGHSQPPWGISRDLRGD